MKRFRRGIAAAAAVTLCLTSIPVSGISAQAAGEEKPDRTVKLQPASASPFNDTNKDGFGEFEGWGTSLCWWANRIGYDETLTSKAAEAFYGDTGLDMNIGRYNVGGGDLVGDPKVMEVNPNAQMYDLETEGRMPTYEGKNMEVKENSAMKDLVFTSSDADFGFTKGAKVGTFKQIGWINKLGDTVGEGDNLHYTVNVQEAGPYTVKLLLTMTGSNTRDVAIRVNGKQDSDKVIPAETINNQCMIANGNNNMLYAVPIPDVQLNAGENTINIAGSKGWTLDFVKMAIIKKGEEGIVPDEGFLHKFHITRSDSAVPGYATNVTKIDKNKKTIEEYKKEFARVDETCGYAWNYDWDADKNQMNILKAAAAASGQDFIAEAFSNSPPYFMTVSGCSSGHSDSSKDNLRADSYEAFAAYMADVIEHWNKEGIITFQSATPMNEPYTNYWGANSNKQEGCHFDQGESQSKIIVALQKELAAKGLSNIILSGTDETSIDTAITSYNNLTDEAKTAITRIDTHTYGGSKRAELSKLAEESGENLWMSEVDGSYTAGTNAGQMSPALGLAKQMMKDVNGLRSSAWIFWNAIDMHVDQKVTTTSDADWASLDAIYQKHDNMNKSIWGLAIADHDNKEIVLTKKYYAYGQFSRYIRPGYSIIGSSDDTLAAYDPESKKVVVVAVNTAAEDQNWRFDLSSFSEMGSKVTAIRTSGSMDDGENWKDVSAEAGAITADPEQLCLTAVLKGNSITTYTVEGVEYDRDKEDIVEVEEVNGYTVAGVPPVLPAEVTVTTNKGNTSKKAVSWDFENADFTGDTEVSGSVEGTFVEAKAKVKIVEPNTTYYIDCNNLDSPTYAEVNSYAELLNQKADQKYTDGSWGYVDDYGVHNGDKKDPYDVGWYAQSGQTIQYKIPLEAGKYHVTFGFKEWWKDGNKSRKMSVTATPEGGTAKQLGTSDTWEGGNWWNQDTYNLTCEKDGVVTFALAKESGQPDPTLSFIKISKAFNIEGLQDALSRAAADRSQYTGDELKKLDAVLAEAGSLLIKASTTQAQLDAVYSKLKEVYTPAYTSITGTKGDRLFDNNGKKIQAHGGQIQKFTVNGKTKYYWYGEDKTNGYRPVTGVHLYTSEDLYNWTDEGVALKCIPVSEKDYGKDQEEGYKADLSIFETDEYFKNLYSEYKDKAPDDTENYTSKLEEVYWNLAEDRTVMERPKVLYNDKTGKYVMWFHADGRTPTNTADYGKARAGIAVSDNPAGPFKLLGTYLLHDSKDADHSWDEEGGHLRDMNLFKDDDGQGYVVYSSDGNLTTYIAKLNADYTGLITDREKAVEGTGKPVEELRSSDYTRNFIGASREAPAMFKYKGKYYLINSGCTGWNPNKAQYAVADHPLGPWTVMGDPCVGDTKGTTFDTQSTCVFPVDAENGKFIYMGDRWFNPDNGGDLSDSRYVWLPVEFLPNNRLQLKSYENWTLKELDNKASFEVVSKLTSSVKSAEEIQEGLLPETIMINYGGKTEDVEKEVAWTYGSYDPEKLGIVDVKGTLTNGKREFTHPVSIVNPKLMYFFDCGAEESQYYNTIAEALGGRLRNKTPDGKYTETTKAGYTGITEEEDKDNADMGHRGGDDYLSTGWWAKGGKNIEYAFDLKPGTYTVAAGFQEWWNTGRPSKMTVKSGEQTIAEKQFTVQGSSTDLQVNQSFEVTEATAGKIAVTISKTGNPDPVISWIAIINDGATEEFLAEAEALSKKIADARKMNGAGYTQESFTALQTAIETAAAALEASTAKEELTAAEEALQAAIGGLKKLNKDVLNAEIARVKDLQEDGYTVTSWRAMQEALKTANQLIENSASQAVSQEEADAAADALSKALAALVRIDKLKTEIDRAKTRIPEDYADKPAEWKAMQEELQAAEIVLAKADATQAEVDQAASALNVALTKLGSNKNALSAAIDRTKGLKETNFTAKSWAVLQEALTKANDAMENAKATQEEVNAATASLRDALAALVKVDKAGLQAAIDRAKARNPEDYQDKPVEWAAMQKALQAAETVLANANAVQKEIDEATFALREALRNLGINKNALSAAIDRTKDLKETSYTAKSWAAMQKALDSANKAMESGEATQEEVNAATKALRDALAALVGIDKAGLKAAIDRAKARNPENFADKPAEWAAMQEALQAAEAVLANADAVQTEIDEAASVLSEALRKLDPEGTINKNELNAAIDRTKDLKEADYTAKSWAVLQEALTKANNAIENEEAVQEEVNAATKALRDALAALVKIDKAGLKAAIDRAKARNPEDYQDKPAEWAAMQEALQAAENVFANADAIQTEIDEATFKLSDALRNLGIDKDALSVAIDRTKELKETDYTVKSWTVLQEALTKANSAMESGEATQEEVNEATAALRDAIAALVRADKAGLRDAIGRAKARKEADYTKESWAAMQAALANAMAVEENGNAEQGEIDDATFKLSEALRNLKEAEPDKAGLNSVLNAAKALKKADYTPEAWAVFQKALADAEAVSKDPKATREQTAAAITSLKKAMDEVKKHPAKKTPNPVKVKKISISGSSKKIAAGKKIKLTAKISLSNASNKEVTWKSSNTKIAKVSKNGVVTLNKKSGGKSVTITAIAKDGSKVKASYKITCMKGKVTKVTITGKKTVKAGKSLKLTAKVKAQKSANKKLKWTSSNTRYAKVSSNGKVTTKKAGKGKSVKITAAATDGSGKKHTVKIKIK